MKLEEKKVNKNSGPIPGVQEADMREKGMPIGEKPNGSLDATFTENSDVFIRVITKDGYVGFRTMANGWLKEIGEPMGNPPIQRKFKAHVRFENVEGKVGVLHSSGTLTLGWRGERGEVLAGRYSLEADGNGGFRIAIRLIEEKNLPRAIWQQIVQALQRMESRRKPAPQSASAKNFAPPTPVTEPTQVSAEEVQTHLVVPSSIPKRVELPAQPDFWEEKSQQPA